ncbi:MAG TPA: filamentous hemagglutinin N-terminal domain-containing protein, partial [Burkholderiaceae bacterium]|nr:filamentous hemagglutinin N-terminal domain-containing protein [Burkholderiaceae bacterium]
MNRHLHRIVFNKARGQLVAVAEIDSGDHGGTPGSASGTPPARRLSIVLSALRLCLLSAFGSLLWVGSGTAQVVVDPQAPSNQRPTLLTAGNGVPVVNIQTPSAGGVSRNTYRQFDVNGQGLVLNNSPTDVRSQLGGWLQANPWLATGGARVILNEVNSPNASQLRGYIEVAGQRAQVIVANPAGITCDGCGFINASRATLTTGTPLINDGVLDGYRVRDGVVTVQGNGLDASQTDYTDIIARAVKLNAGVWAQNLRVTTGVNDVDAAHEQVRAADPATAAGAAPTVAIDVAQLGGMYAGHIRLIGTEAGVGVRNAGSIGASVGEVVVTTEGWLTNSGSLHAAADARVAVQGGLTNT